MGLAGRKWAFALIVVVIVAACNRQSVPRSRTAASGPKIRAIVVTIQTTMPPSPKVWMHTITIANNRARSSDEADEWRLFDFKEKRVTFVDDLAKTHRSKPFGDVIASYRAALAQPLPDGMPKAQFASGNAQKMMQGVIAKEATIRIGAYQRHLWIASHPLIPAELFAMMQASESSSSPLAGVMREAGEALLSVKGFPMADHAELPYEKKKLVVDNLVVSIEQRDVPASLLNVNGGYKEITPGGEPPSNESAGRQHEQD